jgi:hypothetical protein
LNKPSAAYLKCKDKENTPKPDEEEVLASLELTIKKYQKLYGWTEWSPDDLGQHLRVSALKAYRKIKPERLLVNNEKTRHAFLCMCLLRAAQTWVRQMCVTERDWRKKLNQSVWERGWDDDNKDYFGGQENEHDPFELGSDNDDPLQILLDKEDLIEMRKDYQKWLYTLAPRERWAMRQIMAGRKFRYGTKQHKKIDNALYDLLKSGKIKYTPRQVYGKGLDPVRYAKLKKKCQEAALKKAALP